MNAHTFVNSFFKSWVICSVSTFGRDCGHIDLRSGETRIRIFFNLHGDMHWTSSKATVDHVEAVEDFVL